MPMAPAPPCRSPSDCHYRATPGSTAPRGGSTSHPGSTTRTALCCTAPVRNRSPRSYRQPVPGTRWSSSRWGSACRTDGRRVPRCRWPTAWPCRRCCSRLPTSSASRCTTAGRRPRGRPLRPLVGGYGVGTGPARAIPAGTTRRCHVSGLRGRLCLTGSWTVGVSGLRGRFGSWSGFVGRVLVADVAGGAGWAGVGSDVGAGAVEDFHGVVVVEQVDVFAGVGLADLVAGVGQDYFAGG